MTAEDIHLTSLIQYVHGGVWMKLDLHKKAAVTTAFIGLTVPNETPQKRALKPFCSKIHCHNNPTCSLYL